MQDRGQQKTVTFKTIHDNQERKPMPFGRPSLDCNC